MQHVRQALLGIITALVSITLVFGVVLLSLMEGNLRLTTATLPPTITLTRTIPQLAATTQPLVFTLTRQPTASQMDSATPWPPTGTPTPSPTPTITILFPTIPTRTPIPCSVPHTWVIHIVQPGDTLYHLGQVYGIPYTDIQSANCLNSTNLRVGQQLYVPPWATRTPSPTFPDFPALTDTPFVPWTETPTGTTIIETSTPTSGEASTYIPLPTTETPVINP